MRKFKALGASVAAVALQIAASPAWADVPPTPPPTDPADMKQRIIAGILGVAVAGLLAYRWLQRRRAAKAVAPREAPPEA